MAATGEVGEGAEGRTPQTPAIPKTLAQTHLPATTATKEPATPQQKVTARNCAKFTSSGGKWYFSGINRSEEKYFRFCCVHGKVKVVRNQVYRRSKVVLGVLRVLSTLVVGFSVKKGPILLLKLRKVIVFFCELRKTLFSVLTRKKRTFLLHQEMGPFLLNTQQHRWTTLAHQELPCSCDKLDF